jgi:ribosomal-protein-alanine N-acetyltransferase
MNLLSWFRPRRPALAEAELRDAAALARLHADSFHRGWSEDEFERLLVERNVVAHCASVGRELVGFALSRLTPPEAELLSIAVAASWRGRGLARVLLEAHLRALNRRGVRTVFLEVDEANAPARRLYRRMGFDDAGRRERYYQRSTAAPSAALVLRRDVA